MKRAVRTPERDKMLDRARKARYVANNPARALYRHLASRAETRRQYMMDREAFVAWYDAQAQECVYCGMTDTQAREQFGHKLHVDRKDCGAGYIAGNVCLACHRCNVVKSKYLTHEQMKDAARRYFLGVECNAHDELVTALRKAENFAWMHGSQIVDGVRTICEDERGDAWRTITAALAKAGAA